MESLVDDRNGIAITLKSQDRKYIIQVLFEDLVLAYRNTDEGRRLKTINFLDEEYGINFYSNWSFFKINDSKYVEWFNQETYGIYEKYPVEHYVFLTSDDIVEVLSTCEPKVRMKLFT